KQFYPACSISWPGREQRWSFPDYVRARPANQGLLVVGVRILQSCGGYISDSLSGLWVPYLCVRSEHPRKADSARTAKARGSVC
ncbi:mCG140718, partial [Mus musculus]